MSTYKRIYIEGGRYFFTVVTAQRRPILADKHNIKLLYDSFKYTQERKPFTLNAIVILPNHIHCIWTMPNNDADFSRHWQMIKTYFSRKIHKTNNTNSKIWQPLYWEHLIRDERDFRNHLDYIHFNPVKHGYVDMPEKWQNSTLRKFIKEGWYEPTWGQQAPANISELDLE